MNPNFTYAYTLLGHEYVLTEEFDRAMSCFRQAIRTDSRHYNAWLVYFLKFICDKERFHEVTEIMAGEPNKYHRACKLRFFIINWYKVRFEEAVWLSG